MRFFPPQYQGSECIYFSAFESGTNNIKKHLGQKMLIILILIQNVTVM